MTYDPSKGCCGQVNGFGLFYQEYYTDCGLNYDYTSSLFADKTCVYTKCKSYVKTLSCYQGVRMGTKAIILLILFVCLFLIAIFCIVIRIRKKRRETAAERNNDNAARVLE